MLMGRSAEVGSRPDSGYCPVRIDGTDSGVDGLTEVALRYHVDWSARRAKLGKRCSLMCPFRSSREANGSSSRTTTATGPPVPASSSTTWASSVKTREPASEEKMNRAAKARGAMPR